MALQFSAAVRIAQLNAIETTVGTGPLLRIYTGSPPADCAAAASGTLLVTVTLTGDYMANASGTSSVTKALNGTFNGTAGAAGTAGYFRIWDSTGTTCHEQGTVTATGGGGDLTLDNTSIANGQTVTIATKTYTAANA